MGRRKGKKKSKKTLYQQIRKSMPPPAFIYLSRKQKNKNRRIKKIDLDI